MYIKIVDGNIKNYSIATLKKDNPNVSFPKNISDELLAEYGVYKLVDNGRPKINHKRQTYNVVEPTLVDGKWTKTYEVIDYPEDTIANNVRVERDQLLKDSDWTQIADAPVDQAAWATYRQALRDIPEQEGFPLSFSWPAKPQ